jgi:hypothetical protein
MADISTIPVQTGLGKLLVVGFVSAAEADQQIVGVKLEKPEVYKFELWILLRRNTISW